MSSTLGPCYDQKKNIVSFSVYSKNAERMMISFYTQPYGADADHSVFMIKKNEVWNCAFPIADLKKQFSFTECIYYGFRAWGPNWHFAQQWQPGTIDGFVSDVDIEGNRFNPNKLLIDPYAKELSHDPAVAKLYIDPNVYIDAFYGGEFRLVDTSKIAPKSLLVLNSAKEAFAKPKRPLKDDVIYEVHVRGFTMGDDSLPQNERGTYIGAGKKASYLKELGVTAIEFLPVHEFADEQNDDGDPRGDNFWGYMTLNYFSPNRRYACDKSPGGPTREFKEMVHLFHAEGIKVFLDVVYNHTGEGIVRRKVDQHPNPVTQQDVETALRQACPSRGDDNLQEFTSACILSFSGLDNGSYYYLRDENRRYEGRGGCGGNLQYANPVVVALIIDSLRYWSMEMGVDGFRFDLAPILSVTGGQGKYHPDEKSDIFARIASALPSRSIRSDGADLIAEPWGEWGSGDTASIVWLDKFPPDWAVWNNVYRDTFKRAMNKYSVIDTPFHTIAEAVAGSQHIVAKRPWNSINYLVSHDDCNCLSNIFSYNQFFHLSEAVVKFDQITWDQAGNVESQRKAMRNALTFLSFSAGVPMFCGGDELFRRIDAYGNGVGRMNMVSVDSGQAYVDFSQYNALKHLQQQGARAEADAALLYSDALYLFYFVQKLLNFRRRHECLRPTHYFTGELNEKNGLADIGWYTYNGVLNNNSTDWDRVDFFGVRINACSEKVHAKSDKIESIYLAYNPSQSDRYMLLPKNIAGKKWYRLLDTDNTDGWMLAHRNFDGGTTLLGSEYKLHDRSVVVVIEK
ncbi:MAG: hypothetical protein JW795_10520 [Chitinivibrionales bacterium]|nr:hypothetical protein [Chitinivibrionales bacterium]